MSLASPLHDWPTLSQPNPAFVEQLKEERQEWIRTTPIQGEEMRTIKDITNNLGQPSAAPTHVYDPSTKRIWTAKDHGHHRAVRRDFTNGRMMIPKVKKI
jgi:hypothetical protein